MRTLALAILVAVAVTAAGDVVRILDDPRDAAQARVDVIQQARTEVHLLYFLARNDRITLSVLALLRDAKRRGVADVRVIVDGSFHRIPKAVLAHLRDEGVEIRVYHPLTLKHPSWILRRMHEKVIVADDERYITGGRNLGEAYFGLAKRKNYVDRDIYVDGPSARDADHHFETLWTSAHVSRLRIRVTAAEKSDAARRLDEAPRELARAGFIELETGRDWSVGGSVVSSVAFLHDPLDSTQGPRVGERLHGLLSDAKRMIVIESPYFVPSRSMRKLLLAKRADGVGIVVLTNSLRSTDGLLPQAAYLKYRRSLARAGIQFHEYKGPDALHAKSIVVDGRLALIGSYNIDPRSRYLNTEVICVVEDEEFARELHASIEVHLADAWSIPATAGNPRVSRVMSLRLWAARLLLPLIEPQL